MSNLYINVQLFASYCRSAWYHTQLAMCQLLIRLCR